jgi:RNA methyltransferase, TrmH family
VSARPSREIRSTQNPSFKRWRRWILDPSNPECPCIPVEGEKQVRGLLAERKALLLIVSESRLPEWPPDRRNSEEVIILPDRMVDQLSPVRSSQGILAFFDKPRWDWSDLTRHLIYADGLQDPGNLGTIIRTAAATGLFSLVTAPKTVSCFNDKVIRASAGYLFSVPFLQGIPAAELERRGYRWVVADADRGSNLFSFEFQTPLALVVGREGGGTLTAPSDAIHVRIPMAAGVESLNAAVAATLIMYEVLRRELGTGI